MKIKKSIVFGIIIVICIIIVAISVIHNNAKINNTVELEHEDESNEEIINFKVINCTGKKIESLNIFQPENEYFINDEEKEEWYNILEGDSIDVNGEANLSLENENEDYLWDFMIETEDGEFELNALLNSNFVYTGAILKMYVIDNHLGIYDATEGDLSDKSENEQQEAIEFTLINGTGKRIDELHISQKNNEGFVDEEGNKLWRELLDGESLDVLEKMSVSLEKFDGDDALDLMIKNEDGVFISDGLLSNDSIYDGAVLELCIVGENLTVWDITQVVNY